jgi:hypothetical protein
MQQPLDAGGCLRLVANWRKLSLTSAMCPLIFLKHALNPGSCLYWLEKEMLVKWKYMLVDPISFVPHQSKLDTISYENTVSADNDTGAASRVLLYN